MLDHDARRFLAGRVDDEGFLVGVHGPQLADALAVTPGEVSGCHAARPVAAAGAQAQVLLQRCDRGDAGVGDLGDGELEAARERPEAIPPGELEIDRVVVDDQLDGHPPSLG